MLWRARRGLFLVGLLVVGMIAGAGFVVGQVELPEVDPLLESSFVCSAEVATNCGPENALAKLSGNEDRVSVPISEIPQVFIDAVLAAEDRNFFNHRGVDPFGIARALYRDLRNEGVQQGGSTITQQYAKNAFLSADRTVSRKIREAILAIKLEREFSKQEILERYLNTVYFGRGAYGAEAAARAYFGVSIRDVGLSQAAYLAGLIRAPETADVTRDPDTATFRRNSVLDGMVATGAITGDERDASEAEDLASLVSERTTDAGVSNVVGAEYGSQYFVEYVRRLLYEKFGSELVNGGGLRVYTTLTRSAQQSAYEAVYGTLDNPETDPEGALVSIDSAGQVIAMVGGRDFGASELNLALGSTAPDLDGGRLSMGGSGRQAGSSFKPIVLATALERGLSARSRFTNFPEYTFAGANDGRDWEVSNYRDPDDDEERTRHPVFDLVTATEVSSNTIYAQLMLEVGPANVVELAHRLGVAADLPAVNALTLGTGDVSVLDMATAYSTFSRRGVHIQPTVITRVEQVLDNGEVSVLYDVGDTVERQQVLDQNIADQVNQILENNAVNGTGRNAYFGVPIAGKTGTTQDYRDAWFVGYTPDVTTAVWMGYPTADANGNPRYMDDVRGVAVSGSTFPSTIWRAFMQALTGGTSDGNFPDVDYTGEILNPDLVETTTTLPFCAEGVVPNDDEQTDGDEDGEDGDDGDDDRPDCRPRPTTTTSEPEETTTTTAAESTTTTAPPDTVAPPDGEG